MYTCIIFSWKFLACNDCRKKHSILRYPIYIHYQFVLQLCEHSHKSTRIFYNIYYNMLLCTHCYIINRVLALNLHLKLQWANEESLQFCNEGHGIIGIGKMVAQRRTLLILVTSGCNRWSGASAVYQILSYTCMHSIINWTLISSETNLEEQLVTGIQEAYSQPWREAGSQGYAAKVWLTHTQT